MLCFPLFQHVCLRAQYHPVWDWWVFITLASLFTGRVDWTALEWPSFSQLASSAGQLLSRQYNPKCSWLCHGYVIRGRVSAVNQRWLAIIIWLNLWWNALLCTCASDSTIHTIFQPLSFVFTQTSGESWLHIRVLTTCLLKLIKYVHNL